jgi:hypothetical protein
MGGSLYSFSSREERATNLGYHTKSANEIFEQNTKRMIHESMQPHTALLREARDSVSHPNSIPIILGLDVTGSMGRIPHYLIKDGLPTMMSNIIQRGVPDPQVLFLALGDHTCDNYPLQVGQFESGDQELDEWLTRTYIEGHGGGNEGESYSLAWYFGANHTITDHWEQRNQKGFLFTVGDEPNLKTVPKTFISKLMGTELPSQNESTFIVGAKQKDYYTEAELLEDAQRLYNVYHLHIMEGSAGKRSFSYWKELLGDNCIQVDHHEDLSKILADIVVDRVNNSQQVSVNSNVIL